MESGNYGKLFEPMKIKNVTLKNRFAKSSQWFIYPEADGTAGDRIKEFYATIAKGGVGLVIVEESICEYSLGASNVPHLRLDDDRFIPSLKGLAEAIHQYGCPAFVQITHAGPAHYPFDGQQPVAPSALEVPPEPGLSKARELTLTEIREKSEMYAQAALRVKKAGFDGCELHMAHYALGNSFLSRIQNKRTDEYGCQTLESRAKFACDTIRRTRELVGPDFVVGVRMSAIELGHPLGTTNEEAIAFAKMFEKSGVDYIQSSGYGYNEFAICWAPEQIAYPEAPPSATEFCAHIPSGSLIPYARNIKKAVSIPVSGVGRMDCDNGVKAIEDGSIDIVWLGRRLMADPAYPNKVKEGRLDDIRPCLGCMHCLERLIFNVPIECRWNTFMGHEFEMGDGIDFAPAQKKKKVLVVGAGPGGMEAARVAALRGHEVHLYDREKSLGGQMPLAAFIKGNEFDDLSLALAWYERQLPKAGVKVTLGKEVDAKVVQKLSPDAVIVAAGGRSEVPPIGGLTNNGNVVTTGKLKDKAKTYIKYLGSGLMASLSKIYLPVGKKVVVVGGDLKGMEAAEFLVKRGKQVVVVDEAEKLGEGMNVYLLSKLVPWLVSKGVEMYESVKYDTVTSTGIVFKTKEGATRKIDADTVMVIEKDRKNIDLYEALKSKVPEVYIVGDAKEDKNAWLAGSVHDGARAGMAV